MSQPHYSNRISTPSPQCTSRLTLLKADLSSICLNSPNVKPRPHYKKWGRSLSTIGSNLSRPSTRRLYLRVTKWTKCRNSRLSRETRMIQSSSTTWFPLLSNPNTATQCSPSINISTPTSASSTHSSFKTFCSRVQLINTSSKIDKFHLKSK